MVRASAVSHPGIRSVNEDCYLCLKDLCLFVVADATDGLHNVLDDDRLLALLTERESARETAQALVDEALAQGTHDNVTALVVRYEGEA